MMLNFNINSKKTMYHFPLAGSIELIPDADALKIKYTISSQWEDEATPFGNLSMGVYNWAYSNSARGVELHIPRLADGGSIPKNEKASAFFGFDVYGDCFLTPKNGQEPKIESFIKSNK